MQWGVNKITLTQSINNRSTIYEAPRAIFSRNFVKNIVTIFHPYNKYLMRVATVASHPRGKPTPYPGKLARSLGSSFIPSTRDSYPKRPVFQCSLCTKAFPFAHEGYTGWARNSGPSKGLNLHPEPIKCFCEYRLLRRAESEPCFASFMGTSFVFTMFLRF